MGRGNVSDHGAHFGAPFLVYYGKNPVTAAGLPLPPSSFSSPMTSTAPVGGRLSSLVRFWRTIRSRASASRLTVNADVDAGLHPSRVGAETGNPPLVDKEIGRFGSEPGEVQGARFVRTQVVGWVVPSLRPAGEQQGQGAGRHFAESGLPLSQVVQGQGVVAIGVATGPHADDHGRADQLPCLVFVHRTAAGVEPGWGGEVSARVLAHREATKVITVGVDGAPLVEPHRRVAGPARDGGGEGMAQGDRIKTREGPE